MMNGQLHELHEVARELRAQPGPGMIQKAVKDLLEEQRYPDRRLYPGGPPEPPYDEAGWTLPLKMGLKVVAIRQPLDARLAAVASVGGAGSGHIVSTGASRGAAIAFSPESNATTILVNRLLKSGADVRWSEEQIPAGRSLPAPGGLPPGENG